jgi:hypothetical protein
MMSIYVLSYTSVNYDIVHTDAVIETFRSSSMLNKRERRLDFIDLINLK